VQELTIEIQSHEPLASFVALAGGGVTSRFGAGGGSALRGADIEARGAGLSLSGWLLHAAIASRTTSGPNRIMNARKLR
jgi:hypothetical protein